MSVRAMAWAWAQQLQPSSKIVLLALADHADEDGVCWPGIARVAEKTGLGHRYVKRLVARLETQEMVRRELVADAAGRTAGLRFHLAIRPLAERTDFAAPASGGVGGPQTPPGGSGGQGVGGPQTPLTVKKNHHYSPSPSSLRSEEEGLGRVLADNCLQDGSANASRVAERRQVFEHWSSAFSKRSTTRLDPARARKIDAALTAYGFDAVLRSIDGYARSEFHRGGGYTELTLFLRDSAHIERGLELADAPEGAAILQSGKRDESSMAVAERVLARRRRKDSA